MPWLLQFCAARAAFATMFTAWSAALPLLRTDWQMSAWQAGMVQSAYHVGFLISLFSVGFLSDRHGAKRIYLLTSVAAVASGLMFALLADGFASAMLLYGLTGLCSGGSYTPGLAIVAQRMRERQGRALGYYLAAASLGYAIGLLIASAMIPLAGWRGAFIVTACCPLLGMVLGFRALRDVPNIVHSMPDGHGSRSRLLEVVRNKPAMLSIWGYTFHAWELLGMWAWLPAFLAAAAIVGGAGGTQAASLGATLTALTYLAAVVGSVLGGSLSDRLGRTTVTLLMSVASLACSFSFGWMIGLPMFMLVAVAVFYNLTGVADSSIHSTTLTELTDPRYLGVAYSLRSVLGFGAGAISPWVFGLVLDWGRAGNGLPDNLVWGLAWSTLGLGGLLGPVVIWRLRRMPEAVKLASGKR
ncbi:MAG: MFS transporter [Rhodocyclales bacterium]|nr:MFS transporter [Rhodocyclales bacterium]